MANQEIQGTTNNADPASVDRVVIRDFCYCCDGVTECRTVKHRSGIETLCNVCGWQVDFDIDDEFKEGNSEPVGSCENCQTNLYEYDDPEFCDQCLWSMSQAWVSNEQLDRKSDDEFCG